MSHHILIVEDEIVTRTKLVEYFENGGYQVSQAKNGKQMCEIMLVENIDLIILDIDLPNENGLLLTRNLRSCSKIGIILVTGRTDIIDRIVGLEMGADDYVTKPFELRELLVRVNNLLWRIDLVEKAHSETLAAIHEDKIIRFSDWQFDINKRTLTHKYQPVKLTKAEYELLVTFSLHQNIVLSRDRILNMLSHRVEVPNDRTVDILIRRMRLKMEVDPKNPQIFVTVYGEGYMFAGD